MRKILPLIACLTLLFAGAVSADVPAPPVNQDIGFPDLGELGALTEGDCRACHDSGVPDRHHMLYGATIPDPSIVPYPDADGDTIPDTNYGCLNCHNQTLVGGVITFEVERDCTVCHTGDSPHHATELALVDGDCVACHGDLVDNWDDGHSIPTYSPSLVTPATQSTECAVSGDPCGDDSYCTANVCEMQGTACAIDSDCAVNLCEDGVTVCTTNDDCDPGTCRDNGAIECHRDSDCDAYGTQGCSRYDACYADDVCGTENEACVRTATHEAGGCSYCHEEGTDGGSGLDIVNNHDTHHGVDINWILPGESRECYSCHTTDDYHSTNIRKCETCHGYESLHNIAADSDDAGTDIVVGAENAGYSHVGNDDDCWGCHGFATASMPAPGGGVAIPSLSSADVTSVTAGVETAVALTGVAFTNDALTSDVILTAADGATVTLIPDSISQGALNVTIPASLDPGLYDLQVIKGEVKSNPHVINCIPAVAITDVSCSENVVTITGIGFGDAPPAGAEEFINVTLAAQGEIISWTDTEIQVAVAACIDDAVAIVTALYGDSSLAADACKGDFEEDGDVDGTDAFTFKGNFGGLDLPLFTDGDFDLDTDVDGTDAYNLKGDFGRIDCP